jgi:hypothetical protein
LRLNSLIVVPLPFENKEVLQIYNWLTHRFLYHSKWIKNEEDIGFETRESLELFLQKI